MRLYTITLPEIWDKMAAEYATVFYSKWRRIFVRNRAGSILNFKIHYVNLYVIKLTQLTSRDMIRDRSFAANISIANTRICEKCLPKLDK